MFFRIGIRRRVFLPRRRGFRSGKFPRRLGYGLLRGNFRQGSLRRRGFRPGGSGAPSAGSRPFRPGGRILSGLCGGRGRFGRGCGETFGRTFGRRFRHSAGFGGTLRIFAGLSGGCAAARGLCGNFGFRRSRFASGGKSVCFRRVLRYGRRGLVRLFKASPPGFRRGSLRRGFLRQICSGSFRSGLCRFRRRSMGRAFRRRNGGLPCGITLCASAGAADGSGFFRGGFAVFRAGAGCGASGVCPCVRVGSGFRSAAGSRLFAGSGGAPGAFGFFDVFLFVDFLSHVFLKKNVYVGSGGVRRRSGAG